MIKKSYRYIGVDLAVDKLDIHAEGKDLHYQNNETGIRKLLALVHKMGEGTLVAYESTGYVSRRFATMLFEQEVPQKCLNPSWVYYYGKSLGKLAKNDRLDAELICRYATEMQVQPDFPYTRFVLQLREMVAARKLMVKKCRELKAALHAYNGDNRGHFSRLVVDCKREIAAIEGNITNTIMAHEEYGALYKALLAEPGIGTVAAMVLMAYLPELGKVNRKEIGAIAGLVPYDHESGRMVGRRCISGGRAYIRECMYMVQIASMSMKVWTLRDYYEKLRKTKHPKVAITACCRRHLVQLNAKVRDWYKNGCNGTLPSVGSGEAAQASPRTR